MKRFLLRHYPVVIVACCFMLTFVNMGLTSTSFNVFQNALVDVEGVGNFGGSLVVTTRVFLSFLCMFFTHRYYARLGARRGLAIASLCTVAGFCVYGVSHDLIGYCIGAAFTGAAYGLGGMVGITLIVDRWFARSTGTALGWAAVGSGAATFIVPLFMVAVVESVSLSAGFFLDGAIALVLAAVALALLRSSPDALGTVPYGAERAAEIVPADATERPMTATPDDVDDGAAAKNANVGVTANVDGDAAEESAASVGEPATTRNGRGRTLSPGAYRTFVVAMGLLGSVSMVGLAYLGILFMTEGIDPARAALMLSTAGIALTVSKLLVGIVCDRLGLMASTVLFFGALAIGMVLCCLIGWGGEGLAWVAAALTGVGLSLGSTGISLWSIRLSDEAHRLRTIRTFQTAFAFGGFVFNLVPGVLKDLTGTYGSLYAILALFSIASAFIVITILRTRRAAPPEK